MYDRLRVGLFSELFSSVAEEMGAVLERAAFSTNIKERRDYSCALFDAEGTLVAQAAHIPVHLGAMEFLMMHWLQHGPRIDSGQWYITNDPYFAGTHLPDISIIRAVDFNGARVGYVAARAHHSDIGGESPGSIAPADHIEKEGVLLTPSKLDSEVEELLYARTRNREERKGDLDAQKAAVLCGAQRLISLFERYGAELHERIYETLEYAEALTLNSIAEIPKGRFCAEDYLEEVPGGDARIAVAIWRENEKLIFDFEGTSKQREMGINATEAVTRSACYYLVRCLTPHAPSNGGCWRGVEVRLPEGSLVKAAWPVPVVAGNTETSQRIVDVVLQALLPALPRLLPACSQGTMNNVAFGGEDWAYYETIGGGVGAGPSGPGASGIHTHMTNTRNTPAEALELELPLRITGYEIHPNSGGRGRHVGGDGVIREYEALRPDTVCSFMSERRACGPPGAAGGSPGAPGANLLITASGTKKLASKGTVILAAGDRVRIETPGGGGWGA